MVSAFFRTLWVFSDFRLTTEKLLFSDLSRTYGNLEVRDMPESPKFFPKFKQRMFMVNFLRITQRWLNLGFAWDAEEFVHFPHRSRISPISKSPKVNQKSEIIFCLCVNLIAWKNPPDTPYNHSPLSLQNTSCFPPMGNCLKQLTHWEGGSAKTANTSKGLSFWRSLFAASVIYFSREKKTWVDIFSC